ncbi:squalene epoxidase-domain-containing protein [Geopyxis carbonaria]|nr:squalene epoxidase-domain-containing protein [Geopyxis carbonaria]
MPASSEKKRRENSYDVAIVGAGIIGCSLAVALGNQGRKVLLLERDMSEPDRIVGELLQPGGILALVKLGMRDCLEDIDAIPTYGYEVIYHGERVNIPYPKMPDGTRPEGRAFHHGKFIMKLRGAAARAPNVTIVEATAKDVIRNDATEQVLGVMVKRKGSTEEEYFFASLTVSADGYASNFRKRCVKTKPQVRSTFVGLELIDAVMPNPRHGHVIMGNNPPVLLYQIGTHETRALVDMPSMPSAQSGGLKRHLREVVLPDLPKELQPSFAKAIEVERLPSMPNSFLPASTNTVPGMILLGDAMNMRHPLTGGGMTVAFNDVVLLSSMLSPEKVPDLEDTDLVLEQMRQFHWDRKGLTSVINILAQALYSLFAADDNYLRVLQRGCFAYFQFGGQCIDGPVGLLAGIIRQPFVLFYHFFAVAFYSMWVMFMSLPLLSWPKGVVQSFGVLYKACVVIFPYIFSELKS